MQLCRGRDSLHSNRGKIENILPFEKCWSNFPHCFTNFTSFYGIFPLAPSFPHAISTNMSKVSSSNSIILSAEKLRDFWFCYFYSSFNCTDLSQMRKSLPRFAISWMFTLHQFFLFALSNSMKCSATFFVLFHRNARDQQNEKRRYFVDYIIQNKTKSKRRKTINISFFLPFFFVLF